MLPEAGVDIQAADVAQALRHAQDQAAQGGGDRNKFILMGHSAGAHLVALLSSDPGRARPARWLGTVALDGAGMDIEQVMQGRHYRLYDDAFGTDPAYWKQLSPYAALSAPQRPILEVCSTRRPEACQQADHYAAKARGLGMQATVLRQDLSHKDINQTLGQDNAYTAVVDGFLASLLGANRASR
jgi:arylformamidase